MKCNDGIWPLPDSFSMGFPRICAAGGGPPAPGPPSTPTLSAAPSALSAQAAEDGHIGTSLLELWHSREKNASMDLWQPTSAMTMVVPLEPCCLPWPRYPRGSGRVRQLSSWPRAADAGLLLWQMLPGLELLALKGQVTIASHLPPLPPAFLFSIGFQYFSPLFNRGFVVTGYLLMSVRNILETWFQVYLLGWRFVLAEVISKLW